MSNLTSTLTLQLKDDGLQAKAKADAEALKKLGASGADLKKLAATHPEVGKLVGHLDQLAARGAKLDAFRTGSRNLRDLGTAMRSTRAEVASTSAAMLRADAKTAKSAQRAHTAALRREEAATSAFVEQGRAVRDLRKELLASGVGRGGRGLAIGEAMRQVQAQTEAANHQLHQQVRLIGAATQVAQKHQRVVGPSLIGGMGGAGRAQMGDILARRRVADGMSRPHRDQVAATQADAEAHAQTLANRRQEAHEARKQIAGAGLLVAGHAAAERKAEVLHTYREFDDLQRYQGAVSDLSEEERGSRIKQALHLGGETRFNDLQVLHAQLDLAQRGVKKEFIEPFIGEVVNYAQAMNTDLGSAAKTLEGIVFSTNQNVEDPASAQKTMRRNVDQAVKLAKIGGLDDEDVKEAFKFGGPSGSGAGLHNETMGAIFALLRRSGFAGSEAGVATRAAASKLVSPSVKGLNALAAMGLNYNDYVTMPLGNRPEVAESFFKNKFGKGFTPQQKQKMDDLMNDPDQFGDMNKFVEGATNITSSSFEKNKKGKLKVTDQKALARVFSTLWTNMVESVDTEKLLHDFLSSNPTLQQANAFFTDKHGGKFQALAKKVGLFDEYVEKLKHTPEGFAEDVGKKRNAGYAGAAARLEGSQKNLDSSIGQSLDNGGMGNGGFLTDITSGAASAVQSLAELPKPLLAVGASAAYLGGKLSTLVGGALLTGTAAGLSNAGARAILAGNGAAVAAAATTTAAIAAPIVATAAVGAALVMADKSKGIVHGGKNIDTRLDASDELPGLGGMDAEVKHPDVRAIPTMLGGGAKRGAMRGVGSAGSSFGLNGFQAAESSPVPATPVFDTAKVDGFTAKLGEAEAKAKELGATQATPQVNTGPMDNLIGKINEALGLFAKLGAAAADADANISRVNTGALRARSRSFSDGATPGAGAE